jgi:hypothetical protein
LQRLLNVAEEKSRSKTGEGAATEKGGLKKSTGRGGVSCCISFTDWETIIRTQNLLLFINKIIKKQKKLYY